MKTSGGFTTVPHCGELHLTSNVCNIILYFLSLSRGGVKYSFILQKFFIRPLKNNKKTVQYVWIRLENDFSCPTKRLLTHIMPFEVEQKFRVSDQNEFLRYTNWVTPLLVEFHNGVVCDPLEETDCYYNHPGRDFRKTDEALRLRTRTINGTEELFITYKGPKLDTQTKTRRELELPLIPNVSQGGFQKWDELLQALGFIPVGKVYKKRQKIRFVWDNYQVELSLDTVPPVGYFIEVEIIAPSQVQLDATRAQLLQIANSLQLTEVVKRSYLDLVLNP